MARTPTQAPPAPAAPTRSQEQGRTLVLASVSTLVVLMSFVTPLATVSRTAAALSGGPSAVPWMLSAMALGLAVSLLPSGAFADDVGRRRVFVGGLGVLAVGSVVCGLAGDPAVFVVGRLVSGVGAGAVLACALGLIGHAFPPGPLRGHATGVWGASVGGGIAVGGLLTVAVDPGQSWRHSYLVLAGLALVLAVAGRLLLVESTALERRRPDLLGAALLGAGLAAVLAALVEGKQGWLTGTVLGLLAAGAVLLGAFTLAESRLRSPMLDLGLFRRRAFLAATIGAFTNGLGATALAAYTPTVLQRGLGRSLLAASLVTLLFAGTSVVTALQVKRLPSGWSSRALMVGGLLGVALGQVAQTGLSTGSSLLRLVPGLLLTGVAFGVLNATVGREAVASVPPDRTAMGSGANNTARYVGSAIGISLVAVVATRGAQSPAGLVAGWDDAALLTAGLSVVGALAIAAVRPARTG